MRRYTKTVVLLFAVALLWPPSGRALEYGLTRTVASSSIGGAWLCQSLKRSVHSHQHWFMQTTGSDPIEGICDSGFRAAWFEDSLRHQLPVGGVWPVTIDAMAYRRFGPDINHTSRNALMPRDTMRLFTAHDGHDKAIQSSTVNAVAQPGGLATLIAALFGICAVARRRIDAI